MTLPTDLFAPRPPAAAARFLAMLHPCPPLGADFLVIDTDAEMPHHVAVVADEAWAFRIAAALNEAAEDQDPPADPLDKAFDV